MFVSKKYFVLLLLSTFVLDSFATKTHRVAQKRKSSLLGICHTHGACKNNMPYFLSEMFAHLKKPANLVQGMFIWEGKKTRVDTLEADMKLIKSINLSSYNALEIATGIKRFLRSLTSPLIIHERAEIMSNWNIKQIETVKSAIRRMLPPHLAVFNGLLDLLHHLVTQKDIVKVNASQFASAIGSSLIPVVKLSKVDGQSAQDYNKAVKKEKNKINPCLAYLIEHYQNDLV